MTVTTRSPVGPARSPIRSSVGMKALMAVTGILLVLFLIAHMIGNLKIFFGETSLDHYAKWLRELGSPTLPHSGFLWIQRVLLLFAVGGHIWAAAALTRRARAARPVRYAHRKPVQGSYAARTMRWGGVIIVLFVIYHLLDFATGYLNPSDEEGPAARVIAGFAPERWYVTLFYVLAVLSVGFHLRHGIFSALRTLGQQTARGERRARAIALAVSVLLCAGFLSVPFAVLTGLVG